MRTTLRSIFVISLLLIAHAAIAQQRPAANKKGSYTIKLTLSDSTSREKIIGAVCQFKNLGIFAVTDINGVATLRSVPQGEALLEINYLGYEGYTRTLRINSDMSLNVRLIETSLQLKEVHVVAKSSAAGSSTASKIGRQAIDHLQATNLGDLMQLIPGQVIQNKDLTSTNQLQIRTLSSGDNNNSFGASVLVDGIPVSNNANLNEKAGINSTASSGIDVRQIGADNIESVEVIRGIPSAEYGDLTSGAVIVKSKSGKTPYEIRTKVNPTAINTSFGKGWALGEKRGFLNSSFDYVQAWGDPRQKVASFDRFSGSLTYSRTLMKKWNTKTKASISSLLDWRGQDPDEIANGTKTSQTDINLQLSHDGKIALNRPFARTISYVIGYSTARKESRTTTIVSNSAGYMPLLTARESGYINVPYLSAPSYLTSGGTIGTPQSYYFKLSNSFGFKLEPSTHQFNMGIEYRNESNKGKGYYNDNEALPLRPNSDGRPRPFYDIPALNQLSGYLEDNMTWKIGDKKLKLQAGVRYTHLQPGKEEQVWSLSPRLNASIELSKWFSLRGGYGKNSKTPGLIHLYPDKKYIDRAASEKDTDSKTVWYNTNVYDVQRTLGLKNATNTKYELGFDINLPDDRRISIVGYRDLTANGFGNYSEYFIYHANYYNTASPIIGMTTPSRVDTVFATKGTMGNTEWSENRGVEFDFDLGQVKAWHTSFYLTGAYMESRTKSTGPRYSNPYLVFDANTPPFKYLYPSGRQMSIDKRLSTALRTVFSLPRLRMVISSTLQVIWFTSSETTNQKEDPLGYLDTDMSYHPITQEMLDNPDYRIKGLLLSYARRTGTDNPAVTQPPIWIMNTRLTKDISKMAGFSFYVNNTLFYQPWQHSSVSGTLTERNQGTFSFGMEMYFKF